MGQVSRILDVKSNSGTEPETKRSKKDRILLLVQMMGKIDL